MLSGKTAAAKKSCQEGTITEYSLNRKMWNIDVKRSELFTMEVQHVKVLVAHNPLPRCPILGHSKRLDKRRYKRA